MLDGLAAAPHQNVRSYDVSLFHEMYFFSCIKAIVNGTPIQVTDVPDIHSR